MSILKIDNIEPNITNRVSITSPSFSGNMSFGGDITFTGNVSAAGEILVDEIFADDIYVTDSLSADFIQSTGDMIVDGTLTVGTSGSITDEDTNFMIMSGDGLISKRDVTATKVLLASGIGISNIVEDITPQLGGDLELNNKNIVHGIPSVDLTSNGEIINVTVASDPGSIGIPLFITAAGEFDIAGADDNTTAPCVALSLETGTGTKKVLLRGVIRNDSWNWTTGPGAAGMIYLSSSAGSLAQTQPTGVDDVVQIVGFALSVDVVYFNPQYDYVTHI